MEHSLEVEIPLETAEQASAVYRSLVPDPELKPHEFTKRLVLDGNRLQASFAGVSERTLRVGVNSFMDSVIEALECVSVFDPKHYA